MAHNSEQFSFKAKFNEALYFSSAFFVARYPYVCAVLLMLSTGEIMKSSISVTSNFLNMVYAHLGVFFLSATAMSFNLFGTKRLFALVTALQLGFMSFETYRDFRTKEVVLVRMLSRNIAVIGCYLLVAGGLTDFARGTQRHRRLLQTGIQMLGVYSFINAVIIWNSPKEFQAYVSHIPGGRFVTYLFILLFIVSGMCLYSGYRSFHFSKLLAWLLVIVTLFVDLDSKYWWKSANITHWNAMTIASRNGCVIFTLLLIRGDVH